MIAKGDRVRRNPAQFENRIWKYPAQWLTDEGTVVDIKHSRIFGCLLAKVRWREITTEIEVGNLVKVDEKAVA